MINTLPGLTHSAASECVRTAPVLSKARGSFKTQSLPFVTYFCAGDSFLIYLVNSRRGEEEREFLHYGNDGMGYNLPHIHHGRHWTLVIPSSIWLLFRFSFQRTVPPQWAKRALILSLFGMTMFTSYHSIRSQEHDTHPSVGKCWVNVRDTKERYCEASEDGMEGFDKHVFVAPLTLTRGA